MSDKNWLIRTQQHKILGPLSKSKLMEFIERGQLTDEDELSSGNGYWFWIKEKELLNKYIYGDLTQTFNPVSEAADVLTANRKDCNTTGSIRRHMEVERPVKIEEDLLPQNEDLEYPDMDMLSSEMNDEFSEEDHIPLEEDLEYPDMQEVVEKVAPSRNVEEVPLPITKSKGHSNPIKEKELTPQAAIEEGNILFPAADDLAYPGEENQKIVENKMVIDKPKIVRKKKRRKNTKVIHKPVGNDRYLFFLVIIFIALLIGSLWYFQNVLNKPLPFLSFFQIESVHAQSMNSLSKKKTLLNCLY